jgi:hypothetical protein
MPGADDGQANNGQEAVQKPNQAQAGEHVPDNRNQANSENDDHQEMSLEEAQAEIKKLRKENASRRTSNKALEERMQSMEGMTAKMKAALGIEDDQTSPEERLAQLQQETQIKSLQKEVLGIAYNAQIPPDNLEYFEFLFSKKLDSLEEGQELTEEDIDDVVSKARSFGGGSQNGSARTGTNGKPPKNENPAEITLETFAKMTIPQKSDLYDKNPDLYQKLFTEAKQKGLLVQA